MNGESKEKKLSAEEARVSAIAKRFIRQASVSVKNFKMFGPGHPVLEQSVKNTYGLIADLLTGKDSATITLVGTSLLYENIPLKNTDPKVYSLITDMKECNISSLTFVAGLKEAELNILLEIISEGPKPIKDEGGLTKFLQKKNIPNIKADEVFFKKVTKKEEESRKTEKELENLLVMNYLLGKTSISENDIQALVDNISINPQKMGKVISDVALSKGKIARSKAEKKGEGKYANNTDLSEQKDDVDIVRSSIEKIAGHIKNAPGKTDGDVKSDIGSLLLALEPSLRSRVLKADNLKIGDDNESFTKEILSGFSDEILVDLIVSEFAGRQSSIVETRKLIQKLIPQIQKRKKIFPLLEKRLLQKGVPQKTCMKLLEGNFWADMTIEEKIKKIKLETPLFCIEIGIADEIFSLLKTLISERKFADIKGIADKVLDNLKTADCDSKLRLLRDFEKIVIILLDSPDQASKEFVISRLGKAFEQEKETNVNQLLNRIFSDSVAYCINKKHYGPVPHLLKEVGYENVKESAFGEASLEEILSNILTYEKPNKNLLKSMICQTRKDGSRALTKVLISIVSDDFDSYRKRYRIARLLKETESDAETILTEKLSAKNTDEVRNALEALSEIGGRNSVATIEKLTKDKNEKIQKYAKTALKNIRKRIEKH
ncbi:MAG: HEAT repeat domain-containing protein [Candidatus Omnitrophica bacterium]|nr:HEAT repeat domain-containing protein [Candidatus Omnitrophota bacterium]